jgi:hypothetical protein
VDRTKKMSHTVEDLRNLYQSTASGHWFDADTMRFFKSRILGDFKRLNDKEALFISTEAGPLNGPRKATIRKATIIDSIRDDGDMISTIQIETFGEFNQLTVYQAKKLLREYK